MAQKGYLAARIYTSRGSIPLEGAVVTVLSNEGDKRNIIGKRTTDRNGQIPLITISAPDEGLSLSPGNADVYTLVDVRVDAPFFYTVFIKDVQIFAGQTTVVDTPMIPLEEKSQADNRGEQFTQTPQNL